jgi:hypothetical protein
MEYLILPFILF